MLNCVPSIHPKGIYSFFASIESKLSLYENLKDTPALLELAIWKSKIVEQNGEGNHGGFTNKRKKMRIGSVSKMQIRTDSIFMVMIIVPLVFSFPTDGDDDNVSIVDTNTSVDSDNSEGYDFEGGDDYDDGDYWDGSGK